MVDITPQDPSKNRPLWRDSTYITALAAIIAAMIPITAAVNGYFSLKLEREKFTSELRLKYIDRALDTSKDPTYKRSFLEFLVQATQSNDLLHHWAQRQLQNVDEIGKLRTAMTKLNASLSVISGKLEQERSRRAKDKTIASQREEALHSEVLEALKKKTSLEESLRAAELKAGYSSLLSQKPESMQKSTSDPKISTARAVEAKGSSYLQGLSEIVVSGENFGKNPGKIYEVLNGGSSIGPPLRIIWWHNNEIRAKALAPLPPNWHGIPPMFIGITTDDLRYAEPVQLMPRDAL